MINRREFLGITAGAGTALAFNPDLLSAFEQSSGTLLQRAIPSSGEMLPVITFGPRPTGPAGIGAIKPQATDVPAARTVLQAFLDNGGKFVDVLHGGPIGEQAARTAADELGIQNKMFWSTPLSVAIPMLPGGVPQPPDPAVVKAAMEAKFAEFKVPRIDVVMVGAGGDASTLLAVLREMKKEGRVRYIGVHALLPPPNFPMGPTGSRLESIMRNEQIDFVGMDYSVGDRRVEETLLPLAQERKIGFMAYFPFDRGRIFARASSTPFPEWAAEFDAKTWAQFFLKYVLSQPGVIAVRTGTTKAAHMLDNIGGGIGRLPDESMRKRMAQLVDALPRTPTPPAGPGGLPPELQQPKVDAVALSAATLDRYVGEYKYVAGGTIVVIRREGEKLFVKSGTAPEGPLVARTETRFALPYPAADIEFTVDGQGKVTGASWVMLGLGSRFPLERK